MNKGPYKPLQTLRVTNEYGETFTGTVTAVDRTQTEGVFRVRFEMENGNAWNVHTNTHAVEIIKAAPADNYKPATPRQEEAPKKARREIKNDCFGLSWEQIELFQGQQKGCLAR